MKHKSARALSVAICAQVKEETGFDADVLFDVSQVLAGLVPGVTMDALCGAPYNVPKEARKDLESSSIKWRIAHPEAGFFPTPAKASTMHRKPKRWLIPPYVPFGTLTCIVGDGGTCKTTLWCNIVAALSNNQIPNLFDGLEGKKIIDGKWNILPEHNGSVLCLAAEDDFETVILPKLEACNANLANINTFPLGDPRLPMLKIGESVFHEEMEYTKPAALTLDPIQSFVPASVDLKQRNQMRERLNTLLEYGNRYNTTTFAMVHTNKRAYASGRSRVSDSSELWDLPRSVLILGQVPNEKGLFYMSQEKNNYGALAQTILFRTDGNKLLFEGLDDRKDADFVAEQYQAQPHRRAAPLRDEAKEFILDFLSGSEMVPMSELDKALGKEGYKKETCRMAKNELESEGKIKRTSTGQGDKKGVQIYVYAIS